MPGSIPGIALAQSELIGQDGTHAAEWGDAGSNPVWALLKRPRRALITDSGTRLGREAFRVSDGLAEPSGSSQALSFGFHLMMWLVIMASVDQMTTGLGPDKLQPCHVLLLGQVGVILDTTVCRSRHDEVLRFVVDHTPESAFLQSALVLAFSINGFY
jgi:hypothetical protein